MGARASLVVVFLIAAQTERARLLVEVASLEIERPRRRGHLPAMVRESVLDDLALRFLDEDAERDTGTIEPLGLRRTAARETGADVCRRDLLVGRENDE